MKLNKKALHTHRRARMKRRTLEKLRNAAATGVPFEHFRLLLESAERTTDRRLTLNRANASLAILIAGGMGVLAGWGYEKKDVRNIILIIIVLVSLLAGTFCRWWWKQVESYKDLNRAKFEVLGEMAKSSLLMSGQERELYAFDPFFWEWQVLDANNGLGNYKGGAALGSSWSELVVPKAFLAFFLTAGGGALAFLIADN